MNVLLPLRMYSSPSRRAVDFMPPRASEPESGSVMAQAPDLVDGEQVEAPALHLGRGALLHDGAAGQADADAHGRDDARAVVAQLDDRDQGHGRRPPSPGAARPRSSLRTRPRRRLPCARAAS